MTIEINKFFYNKNIHTEMAIEINKLATRNGVSVSRWVNNSKNRQVITYAVHTGERSPRASSQENKLFEVKLDSGYGRRVTDETEAMDKIVEFLKNIKPEHQDEEQGNQQQLYEIVADSFQCDGYLTFDDIVSGFSEFGYREGGENEVWEFEFERVPNEIRLYCYRKEGNSSCENYQITPNLHMNWVMINNDLGYLVVAREVE